MQYVQLRVNLKSQWLHFLYCSFPCIFEYCPCELNSRRRTTVTAFPLVNAGIYSFQTVEPCSIYSRAAFIQDAEHVVFSLSEAKACSIYSREAFFRGQLRFKEIRYVVASSCNPYNSSMQLLAVWRTPHMHMHKWNADCNATLPLLTKALPQSSWNLFAYRSVQDYGMRMTCEINKTTA